MNPPWRIHRRYQENKQILHFVPRKRYGAGRMTFLRSSSYGRQASQGEKRILHFVQNDKRGEIKKPPPTLKLWRGALQKAKLATTKEKGRGKPRPLALWQTEKPAQR